MEIREVRTKYDTGRDSGLTNNIKNVRKLYTISDDEITVITGFMENKQQLIPILIEAKTNIVNIFGDVPVRLAYVVDPEEGWEELFGLIKVELPPEKARALLKQFDREYLTNVDAKTGLDLEFDVEFV
jgi:hypothetical protein